MSAIDRKLLDEVIARPLDDAPRVVLSDALQERSDPRGLFIVAQCRLQERGLGPGERTTLKRDIDTMLAHNKEAWGEAAKGFRYTMRRGFIDEIEAPAAKLAERRAIFDDEPITRLTLTETSAADVKALAAAGAFARLARLTIRGQILDEGAEALAEALQKRGAPIELVNVGANGIGADGTAALAAALTGCRTLVLTGNPAGDKGIAAIAKAKSLGSLTTLFLTATEITDDGVTALAKAKLLVQLARLGLARNEEVTSESLALVAKSTKLKALRWLEYSDEDGIQAIATRSR